MTKRTAEGIAYLANVKQDEQVIEGSRNTLQCLYDSWQKLAEYEDREKGCDFCGDGKNKQWADDWAIIDQTHTEHLVTILFCPMCGRKLTKGKEVANEND